MFSYSKRFLFCVATALIIAGLAVSASYGQYGSRFNAMQQAQMRAAQPIRNQAANINQVGNSSDARFARAQGSGTRNQNVPAPNQNSPVPVVGGPATSGGNYMPQHLSGGTDGQMMISEGPMVDGGSPMISDGYYEDDGFYQEDGYYDDGSNGFVSGGGGCANGNCGVGQNFFNNCGPCSVRTGGCGPACWENCWIWKIGPIFSNAEFFGGATGFGTRNFTVGNQLVDDANFGFYGGANLGLSLCKLTCGLFSGQIGVRSVQSEFEGNQFSADTRDQTFYTAGIFRRVDYGLQAGVVGDFLQEDWIAETSLSQIRGDIGWVYPGGNTFGFRFSIGTEDDETSGTINGVPFDRLVTEVVDNYRFYYRFIGSNCGNCDVFGGWSDNSDGVLGLNYDMPVNGFWGLQSGFTYFIPDTPDGTSVSNEDSWNLFVGFSFRPQGQNWYGNYDRPLFDVADNGTLVFGRR